MKSEYIKEMQELAALKAENELTKKALQLVNISSEALWKENERLKEALNDVYLLLIGPGDNNEVMNMSVEIIESIQSKHEAK